jgi:hypothetical protein
MLQESKKYGVGMASEGIISVSRFMTIDPQV